MHLACFMAPEMSLIEMAPYLLLPHCSNVTATYKLSIVFPFVMSLIRNIALLQISARHTLRQTIRTLSWRYSGPRTVQLGIFVTMPQSDCPLQPKRSNDG